MIDFIIHTECNVFNEEKAKRDIGENKITLLYNGAVYDTLTTADLAFQKKYNIQYIHFIDAPMWLDCIRIYNSTIANYLDSKFGKNWRNDVKRTVMLHWEMTAYSRSGKSPCLGLFLVSDQAALSGGCVFFAGLLINTACREYKWTIQDIQGI